MLSKFHVIDYGKLARSVEFFKRKGYEYMEVPWLVQEDAVLATSPPESKLFKTFAGCLVASGEQSYIDMRKYIGIGGKYQTITPCFRDEMIDEIHQQQFIKNELIITVPIYSNKVEKQILDMVYECMSFFSSYGGHIEKVKTNIGYDIEINGIEVGSYGYREYEDLCWVYGTACAEPRLSQAIKVKGEK